MRITNGKLRVAQNLFVLFVLLLAAQNLYGSECGDVQLNEAKKKYESGNFDEVFNLLLPCIDIGFNENEKVQAYRLLALSYIALDSTTSAYNAVNKMLDINPNFEPNLFDPPDFISMVNNIKEKGNVKLITTVSKKAENIREAPANVMVITDEEIRNRGYVDLEQLFEDLPGFDLSRTYGPTYSNIYQRGYRSNNTDRTLFLIDGVEENELWSTAVFWSRQHPITNVKRVEVVYGPASTMYGANALVGVVNVITKDPSELTQNGKIGVHANAGFGTYNLRYGDLTLAGKFDNVSFSATGRMFYSTERDLSGYEEFNYDTADYNKVNYKGILSDTTSNAAEFIRKNNIGPDDPYYEIRIDPKTGDTTGAMLTDKGAELARSKDKNSILDTINGHPIGYSNISLHFLLYGKLKISDFTMGYNTWLYKQGGTNYFNDFNEAGSDNGSLWVPKQSFFYVKYDKAITNDLLLMNFAQYRTTEFTDESEAVYLLNFANYGLSGNDFYKGTDPFWIQEYDYQKSRQFRNELKIHYLPGSNFDLVSGLEVRNSQIQGDYRKSYSDSGSVIEIGRTVMDTVLGGNEFDYYDLGFYAQGTYKYLDLVYLTLGGRYDYDRIRVTGGYGSQFNPRIALLFKPGDFIFKFIYASAFQNASNWTKFSTNTSRLVNNPKLGPEKVTNLEASASWQINQNMYLDMVYYHSNYEGVVGTAIVPYGEGTTGQNQAIGQLRISGLQSTFTWKYSFLNIYANYTYTDPLNNALKDGELTGDFQRIGDISTHKFNMGVNAFLLDHLNFNLRLNYWSERPVGPGTSVPRNPGHFPAMALLNGAVGYYNVLTGLDIQLICNNILNQEYSDPGIRSADGQFYSYRTPQRERVFIFRAMYNF